MGIVSRMARPKAMNSHELARLITSTFGGGPTASGISVSSDTAMQQETVFSCVNDLQRAVGMLPCHMMKKQGKVREVAEEFYLYPLLHDMPNEWMTSDEHFGMIISHLLLRGNYFALKNRGLNTLSGKVRELIPLAPGTVREVKQNPNYTLIYRCQYPDGRLVDIPGTEIMHIKGLTLNGYTGVNPIQYIRESIGLAKATEQFGARTFGSGTHPSMIITHPNHLDDPKTMREALSEVYAGLDNSHRLMLLEDGMTAQNVSINPEDSQFLETRNYQRKAIVDIFFAMPLTIMCSTDSTPTFASAEQFSIGFVMYALMPWLVKIEKAIYRDLLSPEERKTYYAKFQERGLQRGSFKEQMEGFQIAVNTEILSPNECREWFDLNPYEGGEIYKTRTSTTKDSGLADKKANGGGNE